jgi:hypothetical protein
MDILRCPACVSGTESAGTVEQPDPGKLDLWDNGWLVCQDCQRKYPIRNQIPVLLVQEGNKYQSTSLDDLE